MKRFIVLLLALSMIFALCACGGQRQEEKPDAVKNVERLIDGIGEVSLEKRKFIEDAEAAYAQLYEVDKALVSNYDELLSARERYDALAGDNSAKVDSAIVMAKGLLYSFDVGKVLDILEDAEKLAVTDEQIAEIAELKSQAADMLYDNSSVVKLDCVYSFRNDYDVSVTTENGTMTAKYKFDTNNSTAGDFSDSLSAYKEYLDKYCTLVSTDYDSVNAADIYVYATPADEQVSISRYAKGFPVVGYFVVKISKA